ncbi:MULTISPECIES: hypothetical protein [Halobacillus]|uniref:hypothetical protein n=1 Tax=Halobacillus TaxID=45667 RepID=UPI00136A8488|nr:MULTISPECIES: hypothetical protein [Halobacillus]MYL31285.1 hypothetical protein [Halobacillus halophilus]MYL39604.1 hypothetical protein [Halobacillus litoralis]
MTKIKVSFIINSIITGIFAYYAANFFARGTIAENYSGEEIFYPEFFLTMPLWGLGVVIGLFLYTRKVPGLFLALSLLITWASIPLGINLGWNMAFS